MIFTPALGAARRRCRSAPWCSRPISRSTSSLYFERSTLGIRGWRNGLRRPDLEARVRAPLLRSPIVTLLGPRQCGKTTLVHHITGSLHSNYFDPENPADEARLADPMMALERFQGLVVIDEVQRAPTLFPLLRVLADRPRSSARFLLLGRASPELVRASSESLAGRVTFVDMS